MFFLADIAFMFELFGFCLALVFLHRAKTEGGLVRAAGIILLIGSLVLGLWTAMGVNKRRAFFEKVKHEKQVKVEESK